MIITASWQHANVTGKFSPIIVLCVCLSILCSLFSSRLDPNLWVQALSFFSSRRECKGQISEVLRHIDEDQLMPPLMVIQTLAASQYATLSDIKVGYCLSM